MSLDPQFESLPVSHLQLPKHEHSLIVLREENEIVRDASGNPEVSLDAWGNPRTDEGGNTIPATRLMLFLHEMMPEGDADRMGMNMYRMIDDLGNPQGIRLTLNESTGSSTYVTVAKRFNDATSIFIERGA